MSEAPIYTIPESPVPDPNLFLLNQANRPFMGRHNDYMILEKSLKDSTVVGMLSMGVVGVVSLMALTPILNLPAPLHALVILMILIGGVIGVGGRLRYLERDILVKGLLIPGVVTHAEKIRTLVSRSVRTDLGVRYQFTAPGGIVIEGYDEGDCENASYGMVPAPGTSVYIWYSDEGESYLL